MDMKIDNQVMSRGYDKDGAIKEMRQLRNLIEIAQLLKNKTIQEIAKAYGVSTRALYGEWIKQTGKRWSEGLDIEVRIYEPNRLPEKNRKK